MSHTDHGPRGPCPSDEELGAFIEGILAPQDRARVIAHVVRCELCYEVVAGVLAFESAEQGEREPAGLGDEEDDDEPEQKAAAVVPFPRQALTPPPRRASWALPLAASLLLGTAGGWLLWQTLAPGGDSAAGLTAKLRPPAAPIAPETWASRAPQTYRGPGDEGPRPGAASASYVLLGAYWVDLRLSGFAAEPGKIAQQASRRILARSEWLVLPQAVSDRLSQLATAGEAVPSAKWDELEGTLLRRLSSEARPFYALGACLQTLRFAAEAGQVGSLGAGSPVLRCIERHTAELAVLAGGGEDQDGLGDAVRAAESALRAHPPDAARLARELSIILRQLEARLQ